MIVTGLIVLVLGIYLISKWDSDKTEEERGKGMLGVIIFASIVLLIVGFLFNAKV